MREVMMTGDSLGWSLKGQPRSVGGSHSGAYSESSLGPHTCCSSSPVTLAPCGAASWSSACSADPGSTWLPPSAAAGPASSSSSPGSLTDCKMWTSSRRFSCLEGGGFKVRTTKLLEYDWRNLLKYSHTSKRSPEMSVPSFRRDLFVIHLPSKVKGPVCKSWPDCIGKILRSYLKTFWRNPSI